MTKVGLTLWDDDGLVDLLRAEKIIRPILEQVNPHMLTLHARGGDLRDNGQKATSIVATWVKGMRKEGTEIRWNVSGQTNEVDHSETWRGTGMAAKDTGIKHVPLDCEAPWIHKPESLVRKCIDAFDAGAGGTVAIEHTAYDGPVSIVREDGSGERFGGFAPYSWHGFLGAGSKIKRSVAQIYWAAAKSAAMTSAGLNRLDLHRRSWKAAVQQGMIRPDVEVIPYVQIHGCGPGGLVAVAEQFPEVWGWQLPSGMDSQGLTAMELLVYMHDNNMKTHDLQVKLGLNPDGLVGRDVIQAARAAKILKG